jgi:hypothetical protein
MRAAFLYTTLYRRLRRPNTGARLALPEYPSRLDVALRNLDTTLQQLWSQVKPAA